jgi:hypothetical protein
MSWHYLQGQEAASWAGDCLDGASDALLSLMPTPGEFCSPGRPTDPCLGSQSGTTSAPLTASHGEVTSTSSAADSHARTSASLGEAPDSQESGPASGGKCTESFAKWDPSSSSWKTLQPSLTGASMPFLGRWPTSGLMRSGAAYPRKPLERHIGASGSGLWPTPTAKGNYNKAGLSKKSGDGLATAVKRWPTPMARDWRSGKVSKSTLTKNSRPLNEAVQGSDGGPLNPTWVEWLMGWPLGWTASEPLGTGRFQKWLEQHGICFSNDSEPLDTTQRRGR